MNSFILLLKNAYFKKKKWRNFPNLLIYKVFRNKLINARKLVEPTKLSRKVLYSFVEFAIVHVLLIVKNSHYDNHKLPDERCAARGSKRGDTDIGKGAFLFFFFEKVGQSKNICKKI